MLYCISRIALTRLIFQTFEKGKETPGAGSGKETSPAELAAAGAAVSGNALARLNDMPDSRFDSRLELWRNLGSRLEDKLGGDGEKMKSLRVMFRDVVGLRGDPNRPATNLLSEGGADLTTLVEAGAFKNERGFRAAVERLAPYIKSALQEEGVPWQELFEGSGELAANFKPYLEGR